MSLGIAVAVNRTAGTKYEAVDAPEPFFKKQVTLSLASGSMDAPNLEASFGCETAILHVLEGATWSA